MEAVDSDFRQMKERSLAANTLLLNEAKTQSSLHPESRPRIKQGKLCKLLVLQRDHVLDVKRLSRVVCFLSKILSRGQEQYCVTAYHGLLQSHIYSFNYAG